MPTAVLVPNGVGDSAQWYSSGTYTTWEAVADSKDLTFSATVTAGDKNLHTFVNLPGTALTVTRVDVYFRGLAAAGDVFGAQARSIWKLGGVTLNGATWSATSLGDFETVHDDSVLRPGGGGWTVADVNNLQAGYEAVTVDHDNDELHLSRLWLLVTYTEGAAEQPVAAASVTLTREAACDTEIGRPCAVTTPLTRIAARTIYLGDD